jgi:hypothetical protein
MSEPKNGSGKGRPPGSLPFETLDELLAHFRDPAPNVFRSLWSDARWGGAKAALRVLAAGSALFAALFAGYLLNM